MSTPEQDAAAREVAALETELAEITETLAWLDEVAATVDRLCTPEYIQAKLREVLTGAGYLIRQWARASGDYPDLGANGRIPQVVVDAYHRTRSAR